jgi:hypothetical protein
VQQLVDFGEVAAGTSKIMPLEIRNGGTDLTISAVDIEGSDFELDEIELPLVVAQDQRVTINVRLTPTDSTERIGAVRVISDDPNSPTAEARLVANELCGVLEEITTLFDNTVVGETYTAAITLRNCSDIVDIHVTAFEHSPNRNYSSDFTFSEFATPFILPPGDVFSFDVIFQPLVPGEHAVQFTLSTTSTLGHNRGQFTGRVGARDVRE